MNKLPCPFRLWADKISQWFLNLKYRNKVRWAFFLVSLLPLTVLGIFCFEQTKSLLLVQAEANLNIQLQQGVLSIQNQLDTYSRLSSYLAFSKSISEAANREYDSYYDLYQALNQVIDPTFFMTRALTTGVERITLYTGGGLGKHGDTVRPISEIQGQPWYADAIQAVDIQWFFMEPDVLFSTRRILYLSSKHSTDNIILLSVNHEKLFSPLSTVSPDTCGIIVTGAEGEPIYQRGAGEEPVLSLEELDLAWKAHEKGSKTYTLLQIPIPSCGWTVALYQPTRLVGQSAGMILFTVLVVILLCIIAVMIVSFLFSRRVVARIETLREDMRQVEEGRMTVTAVSRSHDEVGDLIQGFRQMVEKIDYLIHEVLTAEIAQKESELKALQAQINPHFLYNSLSLINWRALKLHASDISEMAQLLSTFYRTTLNRGKNTTTVRDEWRNVESYIKIQLVMHSGSFLFEPSLEDGLEGYVMPNLLLQPLVENALMHGVEQKEEGQGKIELAGKRLDDYLLFTVTDNGPGIPEDILPSILELPNRGYGLKNVQERIQLMYGKEYGLSFENLPDGGCQASLTLPALLDPP